MRVKYELDELNANFTNEDEFHELILRRIILV